MPDILRGIHFMQQVDWLESIKLQREIKMPTIAKHNDVVTVIFSFAVEPRQQELVDMMIDALETITKH